MQSVDVPKMLRLLGLEAKQDGRRWRAKCPDPAHEDGDPSWAIIDRGPDDQRTGSHHCFSCGFGGGPWELVAAVRNVSLKEAMDWVWTNMHGGATRAAECSDVPEVVIRDSRRIPVVYTLPRGTKLPTVDGSAWFAPALEYLRERHVPDWQIARWHLGFAITGRLRYRVVVPVVTNGTLVSYVARAFVKMDQRYDVARQNDAGARPELALFGDPALDPSLEVATIVEGAFKMLAVERFGAINPNAVLGASNLGIEKIAILRRFKRLVVATDPDPAGDKAFESLRMSLSRYVDIERANLPCAPDDAEDKNLVAETVAELTRLGAIAA